MRIGVDGGCWLNRRGYGRYTRNLLAALARRSDGDRYFLFVDPETARASDLPPGFELVVVPLRRPPARAASAAGRRGLVDLWRMSWAAASRPLDVFFFPSVYTFFPLVRPVAAVVVIHDVIAERHPGLVFARRRNRTFWRLKVLAAVRQARLILTVSEHARAGILEHFGLRPERVRVALEAPDPVFRRLPVCRMPSAVLPGCPVPPRARYLLYVGGISPHKNLEVLVEAFRQLADDPDGGDLFLLVVGDHSGDVFHSAYGELRALVTRLSLEDRVVFAGFVPDASLVELYNGAELVVLPSLEEGFGLPAIEAAACGTPVAVSEVGPAGPLLGPAAWTFPPRDVVALTSGLRALLDNPARRAAMGAEGRRRAAALSWDRAAAEVHAVLREAGRA